MIDVLLAVLTKLVALFELNRERKRRIFEDYIDPIFSDLTAIDGDYRQGIMSIRDMLVDPDLPNNEVYSRAYRVKTELDPLRKKVTALARVLQAHSRSMGGSWPSEAHQFLECTWRYFNVSVDTSWLAQQIAQGQPCSAYTSLLAVLSTFCDGKIGRKEARRGCDNVLGALEGRWSALMEAYAKARVRCLSG